MEKISEGFVTQAMLQWKSCLSGSCRAWIHMCSISLGHTYTLYIIPASTARSHCASYMCILAFILGRSLFESERPFFFKAQTGLYYSVGKTGSENLSTTHWIEVFFFLSQMRGLARMQGNCVGWREYLSWMETLLCVITFTSVTIKETVAQRPSVCFSSTACY